MRKIKNSKGITLIALVITIIVLLILAGISIATLTGENGVLTKATTAKEQSEIADAKEQAKLDIATEIAERIETGRSTDLSDSDIQKILTNKDYVEEAKETSFISKKGKHEIPYSDLYKTSTGEQPPIPKGFYHAEGTIEEGFVISDVEGDDLNNSKHGNQFVWVPVPDINDFHTIEGYFDNNLDNILSDCHEPSQVGYRYGTEETEYNAMKQSVEDNHGFYIGRYEAGNDGSDNVIVQKGATVYNNIPWGTSMTDITGGAVEKAKKFTDGKPYSGKVTSTLVYGVQWDATMQFMDNNYIKENEDECAEDSYVRNSEGKGWYSTNEDYKEGPTETGYYEYKHIYDMAGNVDEWTMEAYDTSSRVIRGGDYDDVGANYPASGRDYGLPDGSGDGIGFRLALYL